MCADDDAIREFEVADRRASLACAVQTGNTLLKFWLVKDTDYVDSSTLRNSEEAKEIFSTAFRLNLLRYRENLSEQKGELL